MTKRIPLLFFLSAMLVFCPIGVARAGKQDEDRIILVQGTVSTPNAAERSYAGTLARNMSRWMSEMGIAHRLLKDEDVSLRSLEGAQVALLCYNPLLPKSQFEALASFVSRGGRLIVFYSSDTAIADLLSVRLGQYKASKAGAVWKEICFNEKGPEGVPDVVLQSSRNIRSIHAVRGYSEVIAFWNNDINGDAAWVRSKNGMWMSHVLLDDGDTWRKKMMLLALIGHYDSGVWKAVAAKSLDAHKRDMDLTALYKAGEYLEVIKAARRIEADAVKEYAIKAQQGSKSLPNEFRGVWDHSGLGLYPGNWKKTCQVLADHGLTDIMVNMMWPSYVHYQSDILPRSDEARGYGDQLAQCVAAAYREGIAVHVWKVCWKLEGAKPEYLEKLRKEARLQVTDSGSIINWLCPSDPRNVTLEKESIREMLRNYSVNGVHLDYIRYKDSHTCYCQGCRVRFEQAMGSKIGGWPRLSRSERKKFSKWRCDQITRLVRDVSAITRFEAPGTKVSAAVYGKYPACVESVAQDWGMWLEKGYIDFVCPMNYTDDLKKFASLTRSQLSLPAASGRVYPGIGVTATESKLSAKDVIDQVMMLRKDGVSGFVLFDLNKVLEKEIMPVLGSGITGAAESR